MKRYKKIILKIDEIGFYLECNNTYELELLAHVLQNDILEKNLRGGLISGIYLGLKRIFK